MGLSTCLHVMISHVVTVAEKDNLLVELLVVDELEGLGLAETPGTLFGPVVISSIFSVVELKTVGAIEASLLSRSKTA